MGYGLWVMGYGLWVMGGYGQRPLGSSALALQGSRFENELDQKFRLRYIHLLIRI